MSLFVQLAQLAEALAAEPGRLAQRAAIAEALGLLVRAEGAAEAGRFCLYLAAQPFPEADPRKLNAGGALLTRALEAVSGCTPAALTAAYRRHGDLGAAAQDLLVAPYGRAPAAATLTLEDLAEGFEALAGARTSAVRAATVEGLLRRATALEAKYLLKLMLGDMRIGVKQSLIEEAIAVAAGTEAAAVRHAVMLEADLSRAAERAFAGTLAEARMTLFHPLGFMLASPVETPEEAVERFTPKPPKPAKAAKPAGRKRRGRPEDVLPVPAAEDGFGADVAASGAVGTGEAGAGEAGAAIRALLEDKFDGIRAQLHFGDPAHAGRVALYSRSREDITASFPDLAEAFAPLEAPPAGLILDGEILAWDFAGGKALPFALLGQRIGRKGVPDELRTAIPAVFMAFDVLFAGGELLLPVPLQARREQLEALAARLGPGAVSPLLNPPKHGQSSLFGEAAGAGGEVVARLRLSRAEAVDSAAAVDRGYRDARARANEGVMLKASDSLYLPGRRGLAWLKLKRQLATLDVVITGAEFGSGKRAAFLSDYTFAVRGPGGGLLNLGKAYQGVTDAEIAELTEWLKAHTLEDRGHFRTVEPLRVLEVAFNNVMRSDRHSSGFALRFPRILRVRDDKPVEEIDTLARVEEIFESQPDKPAGGG